MIKMFFTQTDYLFYIKLIPGNQWQDNLIIPETPPGMIQAMQIKKLSINKNTAERQEKLTGY